MTYSAKILIVDDDPRLRSLLKCFLIKKGFEVECVGDAEQMTRNLKRSFYDLIILDWMMPGEDGLSVCSRLYAEGNNPLIIMLTANGSENDFIAGLLGGADDYLAKPFAFKELLARINALLRRPKQTSPNVLSSGNISIDTRSRTVTYKNKPVSLTLKEFMVLEYLLRNLNKVITRDDLYSHAWDFADSSFSNTVDVHIKNLRKKIKDNGKIIQTIRGVGYKIET